MVNYSTPAYNTTFFFNATTAAPSFDLGPTMGAYYRYEYTGIAAIIANLFIFVIITTDRGKCCYKSFLLLWALNKFISGRTMLQALF
jgi:hypothetical protein